MSTFGRIFRVSTFGESHSLGVGCTVEGFPANTNVQKEDIQKALTRRRPGQSSITTKRSEADEVEILCGLENGITLGSPIAFLVRNQDQRKQDYSEMSQIPRPGHADYTYQMKYGVKAESGGGRSSARETIGRVIAGALADIFLEKHLGMHVFSFVASVGDIAVPEEIIQQICSSRTNTEFSKERIDALGQFNVYNRQLDSQINKYPLVFQASSGGAYLDASGEVESLTEAEMNALKFVEAVNVRCPHTKTAVQIINRILQAKAANDSIGGTIVCVIQNPPVGLGEPCFDKLPALLAHAMMSIPATKGFELGSGFAGTKMAGSTHNDTFYAESNSKSNQTEFASLRTHTNNAGGTLGGISSGENIYFRVAFKPVSTIGIPQETCKFSGEKTILEAKGRHDPCVLPRAPPVVDAMASIVLLDAYLLQNSQKHNKPYEEMEI